MQDNFFQTKIDGYILWEAETLPDINYNRVRKILNKYHGKSKYTFLGVVSMIDLEILIAKLNEIVIHKNS